jgi:hypothetical protein
LGSGQSSGSEGRRKPGLGGRARQAGEPARNGVEPGIQVRCPGQARGLGKFRGVL